MSKKDDQEFDDQLPAEELVGDETPEESSDPAKRAIYGWMISGGVHLSALLLAWFAVFAAPKLLEQDTPPTRVIPIEAPPPVNDDETLIVGTRLSPICWLRLSEYSKRVSFTVFALMIIVSVIRSSCSRPFES